jgi:hypothetical protein
MTADRDTLPPVVGALSIAPGPSEYDRVLMAARSGVDPSAEQRTFIDQLLRLMGEFGVREIHRLVLIKGPSGRDCLQVTLGFEEIDPRSYRITLPFHADPFRDPGWIAAELIRQSSAARMTLRPGNPSKAVQYRDLMQELISRRSGCDLDESTEAEYARALKALWDQMSEDERISIEAEFWVEIASAEP